MVQNLGGKRCPPIVGGRRFPPKSRAGFRTPFWGPLRAQARAGKRLCLHHMIRFVGVARRRLAVRARAGSVYAGGAAACKHVAAGRLSAQHVICRGSRMLDYFTERMHACMK